MQLTGGSHVNYITQGFDIALPQPKFGFAEFSILEKVGYDRIEKVTEPFPLLLEKVVLEELFSAKAHRLRHRVANPDPWFKDDRFGI